MRRLEEGRRCSSVAKARRKGVHQCLLSWRKGVGACPAVWRRWQGWWSGRILLGWLWARRPRPPRCLVRSDALRQAVWPREELFQKLELSLLHVVAEDKRVAARLGWCASVWGAPIALNELSHAVRDCCRCRRLLSSRVARTESPSRVSAATQPPEASILLVDRRRRPSDDREVFFEIAVT